MEDYTDFRKIDKCKKCGKEFWVELTPQTPGFRWTEDELCPYCGHVNRQSLEWEFTTYKYDTRESK